MLERLGKYDLLRALGRGSMGDVYLAKDPKLGREVAIKTIRMDSSFGEESWSRFQREAQIVGAMSHSHIVTVFDYGEDQGVNYLVMEYVPGRDLEALLPGHQMPKAQLVELLAQACEGLAHAHSKGVIHRDLKPANILVRQEGERWTAKLTDFGVAQVEQSQLTQEGHFMGTLGYMAPEYLDSARATVATDIFAMGVMLYEIVSGGRRPFPGNAPGPILSAILKCQPEPLSSADWEGLPYGLKRLLVRCLQKDPALRPASADLLAEELRKAMAQKPETPAPEPAPSFHREPPTQEPQETTDRLMVVGRAGGGRWLSLRVALRQAPAGSRIVIMPGHYREAVVVDKDVILIAKGEPGEVIIEGINGPALKVLGGRVTLRGLSLFGSDEEPAVEVQKGSLELEGCTLDAGDAPGATVSGTLELRDCAFLKGRGVGLRIRKGGQVQGEGCRFRDLQGAGVEVDSGGRLTLRDSDFRGCHFAGVLAFEGADARLVGCRFEQNPQAAVHAHHTARVDLRGCTLEGNGFGLVMMRDAKVRVEACELRGNLGGGLVLGQGAVAPLLMGGRIEDGGFQEVEGGALEPVFLQTGPDLD
ncbi:MAG TPA: protein kinase [Holophagaceae bacterium]|nr:protein kinase [Holophagaceae bacterium]